MIRVYAHPLIIAIFLAVLIIGGCRQSAKPRGGATLALINGKVWTVDEKQPLAEAVAVQGNRIIAVGTNQQVQPFIDETTQVINLKGKLVLPGFIDAHTHFMDAGLRLLGVDLRQARDAQDFARLIKGWAEMLPPGEWISGGNWDHERWPVKEHPRRELIDPFTPNHPVFVQRLDGHIALANSKALQLAGITEDTPSPSGGTIVRDPATGEPTGILMDRAMELVQRVIPAPSAEIRLKAAEAAMDEAKRCGVTSIHDNTDPLAFATYLKLWREGRLTVRIYMWREVEEFEKLTSLGFCTGFGNNMLKLGAIKIFADGSMGAGTALFFEPYNDRLDTCGLSIYTLEELEKMFIAVDKAGWQIACHAIGDKANHMVLDAVEKMMKAHGERDRRFRIEHAQVVPPDDLLRYKQLQVIASVQPSHCIDDMRWAEKRIGRERCRYAYQWKSFLDAGVRIAFGTDWYVEPLNPMLGLYAAVTRQTPEGSPPGGWFPEQRLTLEEAIRLYTLGSAFAAFEEDIKGSIEEGKLADMVVLSTNLFKVPLPKILDTKVEITLLGGKIIYQRER